LIMLHKIVKVASLLFAGFAFVVLASFAFSEAIADDRSRDRDRDSFEYIGNAGNCRVYYKRHNNAVVFVTWGTHCAVSSN